MLTKLPIATEWQCSIDLLNATVYRKYQHVSLHNPIKCGPFSIYKKKSPLKQNIDALYKKNKNYKLPRVSTNRIRYTLATQSKQQQDQSNKEGNCYQISINKQHKHLSSIVNSSLNSTVRENTNTFVDTMKKVYKQRLAKFKQNIFQYFKITQKDRCFSYTYVLINHICTIIEDSKQKGILLQKLVNDIEILLTAIEKNKSYISTIKKLVAFKKQEKYFLFKLPQFTILYQILLAEVQMLQANVDKAIQNFELCQYNSRKSHIQELSICFLWEVSLLNISNMKYQQSDENLRNLLEMAVICKKRKAIKYSLQKISLLYFYRGNSIMGQYYFKKSEQGLSNFQTQIYTRQYNSQDEIRRLQIKLFSIQGQEKVIKRKNNPKFETDIWRQSKQEYQLVRQQYMEKVKKMVKTFQCTKQGKKIRKIVAKMDKIGQIKIIDKSLQVDAANKHKKINKTQQIFKNSSINLQRSSILRNSQTSTCKQPLNDSIISNGNMDNVTRVIKTHLSMNRQGNSINKQQRWKKFLAFLYLLQGELKSLLQYFKQKRSKQSPMNRTQF